MKIFLDVGANTGQTLLAALDPQFGFDQIVCFEPSSACWTKLRAVAGVDERVRIEQFGLWDHTCVRELFATGAKGASLYRKDNVSADAPQEWCRFRGASQWFESNIPDGAVVYLKLNCEGAECDILDDLLDSGQFAKVTYAMVDFDVRKIAAQRYREAELRSRLEQYPFPRVAFSKDVMIGATHQERIKNWLRVVEKPAEVSRPVVMPWFDGDDEGPMK